MKLKSIFVIVAVAIIILSNVPPFTQVLKIIFDEKHYRYSNYNGSYTFYEFKSRDFEMMKTAHSGCLSSRPQLKDKNVYRLFSKNPLAFWRWGLYLFSERYKLPYKNWADIEKIRVEEKVRPTTGCTMDF